jgi:2-isopropylmalate synthase
MNNNTKIYIFDTTLRDGEQALASSLNRNEKVEVALAISALGVDIMEVGFPVSSPGDFDSVSAIAREVKGPVICALSRVITKDVEQCGEALKHAERKRIHTFISTSPIHLKHKLGMTLTDATGMAVSAIHTALKYTDDVELGLEDATRTRLDDLCYVIERGIKAGATTIALADTVGYIVPEEFTHLITAIRNKVPNIDKARIAVHCHNDLGLAVANSYAAVAAGATQVECTVNGIGERAGNCSLEEIVMLLNTRKEIGDYYTDIVTENIKHASDAVSRICKGLGKNKISNLGVDSYA